MMNKPSHRPDFLLQSNTRKCKTCGEVYILNLNLKSQPEYWTCPECGPKNKTFITSLDDLK